MLVEELGRLNRDLNIPTPAAYGIDKSYYQDAIEKMSLDASRAGSTASSPVVPTVEQIAGIYRSV
jgi:alcohol dehydrogenase class IV